MKYFKIVCLTGHTRRIEIPGCVQFDMTTNACRGFCVSYSVPSGIETMLLNPKQTTTSVGQCCNIVQSEDVSLHDDLLSYLKWDKFWSWKVLVLKPSFWYLFFMLHKVTFTLFHPSHGMILINTTLINDTLGGRYNGKRERERRGVTERERERE